MSYTTFMRWHASFAAPLIETRWQITDLPFVEGEVLLGSRWGQEDHDSELLVGEAPIWAAARSRRGLKKVPAGLNGKHVCHPEWFATGEPWPTDLPDTIYGPDGYPICCQAGTDAPAGGVVFGGAAGDKFTQHTASLGGYQIGGQAGSREAGVDPAVGGFVFGQFAGDVQVNTDAAAGGFVIGQHAGDFQTNTDAAAGGAQIGASSGDVFGGIDAAAGGVQIGASSGDKQTNTDAAAGGLEIGGAAGDVFTNPAPVGVVSGHTGAIVVTLPANTLGTGRLLVALVTDGPAPTTPVGWSLRKNTIDALATSFGSWFERVADGSSSVTISAPGTTTWSAVAWYDPQATGTDGIPTASTGTTTTATAASVTSGGANRRRWVIMFGNGSSGGVVTPPGTLTSVTIAPVPGLSMGWRNVGTGPTGTDVGNVTSGSWGTMQGLDTF